MSEARNSSTRTVTWLDFLRGDMQHFDGNLRKYPRFKSGSIRLVVIEMTSADSAAYVLKSSRSKVVFDLVSNVEKTLEEIFRKIDERYDIPFKLTDLIINGI